MIDNLKPTPTAPSAKPMIDNCSIWGFFLEVESDVEAKRHFKRLQSAPTRAKPSRDKEHLTLLANGSLKAGQGQIFYNPSNQQLDRIFEGALYGR